MISHVADFQPAYRNIARWPAVIRRVSIGVIDWVVRYRAKAELRALPDYLLTDLGISRHEISGYVDGEILRRESAVAKAVNAVKA